MYKLIIIDDEEKIASGMAQLFPWQNIGFEVMQVFTGARKALQYIAENPVDVVLSDIAMPGDLDGIALATALRQRPRPLPVVLMSGYASRLDEAVRQELHVLPKPCTPEMLSASLRRALATRTVSEG